VSKKGKKSIINEKGKNSSHKDYRLIFLGITLAGLIFRILLLGLPPKYFYPYDHLTNYVWWRHSVEYGLLEDYGYNRSDYKFTCKEAETIQIKEPVYGPDGRLYQPGDIINIPAEEYKARPINYPPLAAYITHIQGLIHRAVDDRMEPLTLIAWLILEFPSYICDWILALGCMFIVCQWKNKKSGIIAYSLMWLCPGILLTGVLWGQCDSWFLAPSIWCIHFCLKEQWVLSGVMWGTGLMMKPQTLLMAAGLAYFFITTKKIKPFIIYMSSALAVVLLLSAPFMYKSGLAWFYNSYVFSFVELLPYSTLKAFNIWMIDLIRCRDTSIDTLIFTISKKTWGLIFLTAGLIISTAVCRRKYRNNKMALPMLVALTFAVTFLFPTRVHERYIIYFLPFLMISTLIENNYWITFTGYSIIAFFEVTHHIWLREALNLQNAGISNLIFLFLLSITAIFLFFHWIKTIDNQKYINNKGYEESEKK
jgi:Gpi18-like mannosyltransferase